jgi:hypothetical protein
LGIAARRGVARTPHQLHRIGRPHFERNHLSRRLPQSPSHRHRLCKLSLLLWRLREPSRLCRKVRPHHRRPRRSVSPK